MHCMREESNFFKKMFDEEFLCVAQATLNLRTSDPSLPRAGIIGVHHHTLFHGSLTHFSLQEEVSLGNPVLPVLVLALETRLALNSWD